MVVISLLFHYSWNSVSACFNYSKLGCFFELTILHWNCEPPLPCKSSSVRLNLPLSCITLFHIFASVLRNMNTFRCNIHGEYLMVFSSLHVHFGIKLSMLGIGWSSYTAWRNKSRFKI